MVSLSPLEHDSRNSIVVNNKNNMDATMEQNNDTNQVEISIGMLVIASEIEGRGRRIYTRLKVNR